MLQYKNIDRKGGLHQANGHEPVKRREWTIATLITLTYTASSLRSGISITSKVTLTLGYSEGYSMDFILLSLMTRSEAQHTYWFIPGIAADGTKDNSWPFGTGILSIGFKNHRILIDMMTFYSATRQHVIKINFMCLIIQCKNISCNKFLFFKKKTNILTTKKYGSMVYAITIVIVILLCY